MTAEVISYARVSTKDQNLDLQRDALERAGGGRIYEDRASGASGAAGAGACAGGGVRRRLDRGLARRPARTLHDDLIALTRQCFIKR